ncbi:metallopeptidase family protein [Corynebacterium nasicanis]|uniref:Metallopeptidase family protein n=1 Tax=Corynebacterium nasicanis TaxID=1448267 RepID=A0ABW1QH76_9CORY
MHTRTFRDRRGRGVRGPLLPMDAPRYRTRAEAFDVAVLEAYAPLQHSYPEQLAHLDIAVDTVPRMRLRADMSVLPDEIVADGPVPLGRVIPAGIDAQGQPTRARLVLFRMPIEQRSATPEEREELLTGILTALVAQFLNLDPRDIDPEFPF